MVFTLGARVCCLFNVIMETQRYDIRHGKNEYVETCIVLGFPCAKSEQTYTVGVWIPTNDKQYVDVVEMLLTLLMFVCAKLL